VNGEAKVKKEDKESLLASYKKVKKLKR